MRFPDPIRGIPQVGDSQRFKMKAGDRGRTGNIQLGRLTLYQLSYTRVSRSIVAEPLKVGHFTARVPPVPPVPRNWPMWPMDLSFHPWFGSPDAACKPHRIFPSARPLGPAWLGLPEHMPCR